MAFIPYGKQVIDEDDIAAVTAVLKSDFLTQGPKVSEFEQAICHYTGAKYCVAVANGTAALHMAVLALEIEPGSEGITSPITFVASANALLYAGLKPIFADIDAQDYTLAPMEIRQKISPHTKVIIPVHFAGQPAQMPEIAAIAHEHRCFVIEDAAHAIGSRYENGQMVGSGCYADLTIFSFHPVKTITTGEGGAITTNNPALYERLCLLRTHGITKDEQKMSKNEGPWYYEMRDLGFNYRLTDLQAALGITQLKKLPDFIRRRRAIVAKYNEAFQGLAHVTIPQERPDVLSAFHLYVLLIDFAALGKTRVQVMAELKEKGIGTQVHYIPVPAQPYYQEKFGYPPGSFPISEAYYQKTLSLPLYPGMTEEDVDTVIKVVLSLLPNE